MKEVYTKQEVENAIVEVLAKMEERRIRNSQKELPNPNVDKRMYERMNGVEKVVYELELDIFEMFNRAEKRAFEIHKNRQNK